MINNLLALLSVFTFDYSDFKTIFQPCSAVSLDKAALSRNSLKIYHYVYSQLFCVTRDPSTNLAD